MRYKRQDDEIGISGVTVQLVEKCVDGSEYIWQETTTDSSGHYEFAEYITRRLCNKILVMVIQRQL